MAFTSLLYPGEKVISVTDPTPMTRVPAGLSKGYEKRDYKRFPIGYSKGIKPFSRKLIPRDEWDDRIAEKEKKRARLSDILLAQGIPSLDQNGTNYCWFNGVVTACIALRAKANLPYRPLSAAWGAAQIKGFRNQGGWGGDALEWMIKHGTCEQKFCGNAQIDRSTVTAEATQNALMYRVTEDNVDVEENDFDAMATLLLNDIPCPLGLDWWSHLICACDLVKISTNLYGTRIRNSWADSYGYKGFAVLEERKSRGDVSAPRVMLA